MNHEDEPVEIVIDGVLDLHAFLPSDTGDLVSEYITECLARDIRELRIIHGKGTGTLRKIVHSVLERDSRVRTFRTAPEDGGGWGATIVTLY